MSLVVQNSRELLDSAAFKLKVLLYAMPGWGKTLWGAGSINPGLIVCDTGHGNGVLTAASRGVDYVKPSNMEELEAACGGAVFKDKDTIVWDSLSDACHSIGRAAALAIPRAKGSSGKRAAGVLELDDYMTLGELIRRPLRRLLDQPKHIVVTATLRIKEPREGETGPVIIGPDLPGSLMLGSSAMFDVVLCGMVRQRLLDPKDPKSRVSERYVLTQPFGAYTAKSRLEIAKKNILPDELVVARDGTTGSFDDILARAKVAYAEALAA